MFTRTARTRVWLLSVLTTVALLLGLAPATHAAGNISVYVTFEGYNLGQGYYIEPVKVSVPEGSTAAAVTETVLDETSHAFEAAGAGDTSSPGWYLAGVKGFDTGAVTVPSYITSQPGFELKGTDGDDYLSQFDYHAMSGWMYTVDNATAQVGAGAFSLDDGDVVRWQFTLHGYGCDLGLPDSCYEGEPYFDQVDKSDLIRTVARGRTATATGAELRSAKAVAVDPLATQDEVDEAIDDLDTGSASTWVRITTTSQGQLLTQLREKLVSDFDQTPGSYDYSVVTKLNVTGTLNSQDYADLRNAAYAGTHLRELDLSGVVDATTFALSGMTALTDVSLPPVGSYTVANPFQGNTSLRHVVVAAETYVFGSATTFNGITGLERITFLHPTKPSMNASTFAGSNNAIAGLRTVTAVVPDRTRGDYDAAGFTQYFADVVESPTADDRDELDAVIDDATAIAPTSAAAEYRWTLLQESIAAATTVHDTSSSTGASIYRARLALQTAISRVGVAALGLSLKATHGADVTLSWKNGTAQHYAEFTPYPLTKVDDFSDSGHDVYVPTTTVPYTSQKIASAVIPDETDKVAKIFTTNAATAGTQYTLDLVPIEGRQDTSSTIPGLGAGDNRGLYTNLDDTGVLDLEVGEHFDLDTFRTQQGQLDQVNNLFVEPDYTFEVAGDSISTRRIGLDGRRQLRIKATKPGVSVVKVTYGPLHYLAANDNGTPGNTNWSFNGIDPQNTGVAVVHVGDDGGTFETGIDVKNELDTYYFDRTVGDRDFTFTPAEGTSVRVHDPLNVSEWGDGWSAYDAAADGSVTVKLKGGRNIVELTKDGKVQYRVVRAKGVSVTVTNTTSPGQPFVAGDNARIAISGVEGGVEKLAGIYNPAFNAGTKARLTYDDGGTSLVSNEAVQYQAATTTFTVNYPYTGAGDTALNGDVFIGGLGAEWPYHRQIPLEGKPANLAAVAIGPYHFGGLPTIYVHGDQVSTSPGQLQAPTALQATHGDGSAEVAWTAPTPTSGLPVLGYRVRYSANGGDDWTTASQGTATTRTLTDLTNGTEYLVQVAAVNSAGTGAYTASRSVTPRTVPSRPTGVTLTPHHTSVDVAWTAPADGGSALSGHRVRYSSDGGESWTTQEHGTGTERTLTGLDADTTYAVQVAAVNGEGAGQFTASVTTTTVTTPAVVGAPEARDVSTTGATIVADVDPGDLDQEVTVEYSTRADHGDPVTSPARTVPAGSGSAAVSIALADLASNTTHHYRVVATASDGEVVASDWDTVTTHKVPAELGEVSVSAIGTTSASIAAVVTPGDLDQQVRVQYSTHEDHSDAVSSPATTVAGGTGTSTVTTTLSGLAPGTEFFHRVVLTASDGDRTLGDWRSLTTTVPDAPTVSVTTDATDVRVGDTIRLEWTAQGADTLTASGDWSGAKSAAGGSEDVVVDRAGDLTFTLAAEGEGGRTQATVHVDVALPATRLTVKGPSGLTHVGRRATVGATGLEPGEAYRITIAGIGVDQGVAPASGVVSRSVVVPKVLADGPVTVRVVGSTADRSGSTTVRVVGARSLFVKVSKRQVARGGTQRVTASGLAPYEKVRIVYRGRRIATVTATNRGTVTRTFAVGGSRGVKTVKVFGLSDDRTGSRQFRVTR